MASPSPPKLLGRAAPRPLSEALPVAALDDALPLLRCPVCGAGLARAGAAVRCAAGHSFDVARQGYLSLPAGGRPSPAGDTAAMVAARERFLEAGHFEPLAAEGRRRALSRGGAGALRRRAWSTSGPAPAVPRARARRPPAQRSASPSTSRSPRCGAPRGRTRAWRRSAATSGARCRWRTAWPLRCSTCSRRATPPRSRACSRRSGVAAVVTPAPGHLARAGRPLGLLSVDARKHERLAEQLAPDLR